MAYKVPDEETVSAAIRTVMNRNPHIETQREFSRLVGKELSKADEDYRVRGERARRIGLDKGLVRISIDYRDSDIKDIPEICPVCRNAMSPVMNTSLDGEYVEIKRRCTVCPYSIGKTVLVPGRYVFSKSKEEVSRREASLRKLRKARAKIREAEALIEDAVNGTEFQERGADLISDLREAADSRGSAASIRNISLDIKEGRDDPAWMEPTVSVKNRNRKDI